jgi:hypothetical protein
MQQIQDGRRNVLIHPESSEEDLPVEEAPDLPGVADTDPFIPKGMSEPKLYPGDVIFGVDDGEIQFAELLMQKTESGVMIVPLDSGSAEVIPDGAFGSRFYKADEIHVYEGVADEVTKWDIEYDESKLERPETGRPR